MSNRRIARRIALAATVENVCAQGVSAPTLATKVFHLLLSSFPRAGRAAQRRWVAEREPVTVASERAEGRPRGAGVQPCQDPAPSRRLASRPAPRVTPFATPTLATNGGGSEVMQ
jgi:hypothetical protein